MGFLGWSDSIEQKLQFRCEVALYDLDEAIERGGLHHFLLEMWNQGMTSNDAVRLCCRKYAREIRQIQNDWSVSF